MNYYEHHIGDYAEATAHLSFVEDAAYSRLIRKYYAQEKPLPADIKAVQRLVGARSKDEREAVELVLNEFFDLRADGWHQARCDSEIAVYQEKAPDREAKRENERERQRRARERRKQIFDALRDIGVVPAFDAPMSQLNALLSQHNITLESHAVTRDITPPVTRDDTATQTPDTRHQTKEKESARSIPPVLARALDPDDPPEAQGQPPTPGGAICQAMRRAGLQATNPGDPRLLALIAQGATLPEFEGIAAEAVAKGKGWAWVLTVLPARRAEAAAISLAPAPQADPKAWLANRRGVIERGCAVGIGPWDESNAAAGTGPSWAEYRAQVIAADAAQTPQETAA